jgi:NAD(P)-dependent dehydrogenase (short-subunit alcohol dehydrogenase family)
MSKAGNRQTGPHPLHTGTAVVTGASTGIGRACALHLDRLGFQVFAGVRQETDGKALKEEASDRLVPILIDVTDAASIASAVDMVTPVVAGAGLCGLVNNAGILIPGPLEFTPIAEIRKQLEVNVIGHIAVTQAFLPLLREGHGRIVNIGSINGRVAAPFIGAYCAAKFAIEALTDALRMELRPWDISIAIVEPGSTATPMWDKAFATSKAIQGDLPQWARDLYAPAIAAMGEAADKMRQAAISPEAVARAVAHALTARRPKTRYLVGRDARILAALAQVLPDRALDNLLTRQMGLRCRA